MRPLPPKKPSKDEREKLVLLGLVELYIKEGKPIGSTTLKGCGFDDLSSATIRNYFAHLEETGFLKQQHASGGRIPTSAAFKLYADEIQKHTSPYRPLEAERILNTFTAETKEVSTYLQKCAETLSEMTQTAVFLSSPRFDQDFILDVKMVAVDSSRCLCVLVTDFGVIKTEILYTDKKLSSFTLKRIEQYFQAKITAREKPEMPKEEEILATRFYNEVMLRHIVSYSNFSSIDILKTGFSRLLSQGDFTDDAQGLAMGLSLFEDSEALRRLLSESCKAQGLTYWIGEGLSNLHSEIPSSSACAALAVPYKINQTTVGAIGLLGPVRLPYKELFAMLQLCAEGIGQSLTRSLYKFKISYRQPKASFLQDQQQNTSSIGAVSSLLIEEKKHKE